jgi:hypothetical protein
VKEEDIRKFHEAGSLVSYLICSPTTLNFPTIDNVHIVCFESHLICGLGLLPNKFSMFVTMNLYEGGHKIVRTMVT